MTIQELLRQGAGQIEAISETPLLDVQVLLAHILNKPRTWVLAHPERSLNRRESADFALNLEKLAAGEPLPYLLGKWEFYGLEFNLTHDVLIPRPETELLVEKAINWLKNESEKKRVADIGTGSGIIGVSLAVHIPDIYVLATDISADALQVARRNAQKFNVENLMDFVQCDLLPEIIQPASLDLICSNPPYIPTDELQDLPVQRHEPMLALDGGRDGLETYRRIFEIAPQWIAPHGLMLLETEASLGIKVLGMACDLFPDCVIHLHQDLAGHDRLLEIQF